MRKETMDEAISAARGSDDATVGQPVDGPRTLAIDIGGTGLKMLVLDATGTPVSERDREKTPRPATPQAVLETLTRQIARQPEFSRVSVGFPGVVVDGIVHTAPNLDGDWTGFDLADELARVAGRPVRAANDADVQGLGDIEGEGVELVLTLGTGMGSALFVDGRLVPNLELGHHPFKRDRSYEDYLGKAALEEIGKKRWRRRVHKVLAVVEQIWNPRHVYLGGGNAKLLQEEKLAANVSLCPNTAGLTGGLQLWR